MGPFVVPYVYIIALSAYPVKCFLGQFPGNLLSAFRHPFYARQLSVGERDSKRVAYSHADDDTD
jgi:hypothetical protein